MDKVISSVFSGVGNAIGKVFHSPLDFLSGKNCSSVCGSTWDLICYIENFCVANILKLIMALISNYSFTGFAVLLYLYLVYKVGICQCIAHSLCRMAWKCISCCFSSLQLCCNFLCNKLRNVERIDRRRKRVIETQFDSSEDCEDSNHANDDDVDDGSLSYSISRRMEVSNRALSGRSRNYKGVHLKRSLRPRNHRIKVGIGRDMLYKRKPSKHINTVHDIRVTHTSKFAHKGSSFRGRAHHSRRSL
ncbi:hypothetical protein GQ457_03G032420 [Hibiscus cannabinus]